MWSNGSVIWQTPMWNHTDASLDRFIKAITLKSLCTCRSAAAGFLKFPNNLSQYSEQFLTWHIWSWLKIQGKKFEVSNLFFKTYRNQMDLLNLKTCLSLSIFISVSWCLTADFSRIIHSWNPTKNYGFLSAVALS